MKVISKVLVISTLFIYPCVTSLLAMDVEDEQSSRAVKGTISDSGYTSLIDERPPYPHLENPHKTIHTVLSAAFLEQHNMPNYNFPTSEKSVTKLGQYEVDRGFDLGSGDDGHVYLARHKPTGIFAAAKSRAMTSSKEDYHAEFKSLTALGQLYGAWSAKNNNPQSEILNFSSVFLIMPLVDGKSISKYGYNPCPWLETNLRDSTLEFSDITRGIKLIKSMRDQLVYISKNGATHDHNPSNILVTNDYQDVVLVDFGYSGDKEQTNTPHDPYNPTTFSAAIYGACCHNLLGTGDFRSEIKEGEITEPAHVVDFLKVITIDHWDLKLDRFLEALDKLLSHYPSI